MSATDVQERAQPKAIDPALAGLPEDPRAAEVVRQGRRGMKDATALRELVFAHPDLKARLTGREIGCPSPDAWNGFIPPAKTAAVSGVLNTSPRRRALVELCAEAVKRLGGAEAAEAWKQTVS